MKKMEIFNKLSEIHDFPSRLAILFYNFKLYLISKILLYNESYIYNIRIDWSVQTRNVQQSLYIGKTNYIMKI